MGVAVRPFPPLGFPVLTLDSNRDTMVRGFISGYEGTNDIHPPIPELAAASHALIRLALILTSHTIA